MAHNNHIQKTPIVFDDQLTALPMGHYLANELGLHYRAIALTHTARTVPDMNYPAPIELSEVGFTVSPVTLEEPEAGSVEAVITAAGLAGSLTLTDLRGGSAEAIDKIRTQSATLRTPVSSAFDAVLSTPTATMDFQIQH